MMTQPTREPQQQPLTSIEHGSFDTAALQRELAQALEDDRKYRLTDSMKKRAIHTAASYDEFKNLVACADLKPMSQKELRNFSNSGRSTNLTYKPKSRKSYGSNLQLSPEAVNQPPKTAVEFARQWRRSLTSDEEKYRYLKVTTSHRMGELFRAGIDADLLAEIVSVIVERLKNSSEDLKDEDDAAFAYNVLETFTKTSRFALTIDFLDNNQKEKLRGLLENLSDKKVEATGLSRLRLQYRV